MTRTPPRKLRQSNNAHNAGKFNKLLIAESELKAIQAAGSAARSYLYTSYFTMGRQWRSCPTCYHVF